MKEFKPPDLSKFRPIIVTPKNKLKTVELLEVTPLDSQTAVEQIVSAVPYYLLAYGHNLKKLGAVVAASNPVIGGILTVIGKGFGVWADHWHIDKVNLG